MWTWNYTIMLAALALGVLPALTAIIARYELRIRRLKSLLEVYRQFDPTKPASAGSAKPDAKDGAENGQNAKTPQDTGIEYEEKAPAKAAFYSNPLVDLVKTKYTADLRSIHLAKIAQSDSNTHPAEQDQLDSPTQPPIQEMQTHIEDASRMRAMWNGNLFFGAIVFGLSSAIGFYAFLCALFSNFKNVLVFQSPNAVLFEAGSVLVIGSIVFVGAYIAAMRLIIQAVTSFDLTGYTFVRQGGEVLFSVLLGMLIFKAFPDPMQSFGRIALSNDTIAELAKVEQTKQSEATKAYEKECVPDANSPDKTETVNKTPDQKAGELRCAELRANSKAGMARDIPWYWFVLAAVFGLVPNSSSRYLLNKAQGIFGWTKTTDERFANIMRITPVDILDGVDFETRYRLEECGMRDVQNLACANPVMLAIESPFNLNEIIDWVGQAQLCHIVGVERYMLLREYNVRTIFDLERAIDSIDAPDTFDIVYGSILLSPTDAMKMTAETTRIKFLIDDGEAVKHVALEEFTSWAYKKISRSPPVADQIIGPCPKDTPWPKTGMSLAVEHMMYWISDDLHVRRLRRLWIDIENALGADSAYMPDSRRRRPNTSGN